MELIRDDRKHEKIGNTKINYKEKIAKDWILEKKQIQREKQKKMEQEKNQENLIKQKQEEELKLFGLKNGKPKKNNEKGQRKRKISKTF
jgi:hypothetical protein